MEKKDKRVDVYIAKSADFAQPILHHVRRLVHSACPDVEETIKWGFPNFEYNGILCNMASFKNHCAFGFWKASLMSDLKKLLSKMGETSMGNFGQLKSLNDLPSDKIIIAYIKEAMRLNEEGVKIPSREKRTEKAPLKIPNYLKKALNENKKAQKAFEGFNYSNKKEYIEWVIEAKTEETRSKRLATSIEWMAEGKTRNWKYIRKK